MRPEPATLRRILEAGILAPSAENKHYLVFRITDEFVDLLTTDRASWAEKPHRRLLALMAFGAVIENMALESGAVGLELDADTRPSGAPDDLVARLSWSGSRSQSGTAVDPLQRRMASRSTNRRFYRRGAVEVASMARVGAAAADTAGCRLLWLDAPPRRKLALRAIRLAETERFRRRALHDELFGAVRFDRGWQRPIDEWLAPAALEVEAPMRLPFAAMRHWPLMRAANLFGAHHAFGLRAGYLPSAGSPHIGLIVATKPGENGHENDGSLAAGRSFQRLWLAADAEGLALQPMAAATALVRQTPGGEWVSATIHGELQRILAELTNDSGSLPCMLFRMGRAAPPSARAGRRSIDEYIAR